MSVRSQMKSAQIAERVKARDDQHQKFGGVVGLLRAAVSKEETDDGDWWMTEEERGRARKWLMVAKG
ncbi:MAG: hypothetical protein JSS51_09550 [Planctomycetes bacterium]|nr:hypothetical protein [Planctomycetota bacterium]